MILMGSAPPPLDVLCASSGFAEPIELTLRERAHGLQARDDLGAPIGKVASKGLQRPYGAAAVREGFGRDEATVQAEMLDETLELAEVGHRDRGRAHAKGGDGEVHASAEHAVQMLA